MLVSRGAFAFGPDRDAVRADFEALRALPPDALVARTARWVSRAGAPTPRKQALLFRIVRTGQLLAEACHWRHRVRTSTRWQPSGEEALRSFRADRARRQRVVARLKRSGAAETGADALLYKAVRTNSALMTMTHFRASVSKALCDVEGASRVLDFSAGWGDRLTGFLAADCVAHITLIDPRASSLSACRCQHALVRSRKTLVTHQRGAEVVLPTLKAGSVDLIVTSPPYFDLERYGTSAADQAGQVWKKASTPDEYLRVFLFPVLAHCARVLAPGGLLALNLDDNPTAGVRLCAPALAFAKTLPGLRFEGTAGLRKGKGFGKGQVVDADRAEPVYCWRKAGGA